MPAVSGHRWTPPAAWLAVLPVSLFAYFVALIPRIERGEVVTWEARWIPSLDVSLALRIDGLSLVFALLITGIGALIVVYADAYMGAVRLRWRFFAFLLLFMAAMLGVVLADDLIALFVFWELTSITSFALIGFEHRKDEARSAAQQALLVTGAGGLALLTGLLLLAVHSGGLSTLSGLAQPGAIDASDRLVVVAVALIGLGAFTKSAQVPFHFWLPGAMAAPTPVSAYLHSATMVKAGVYLLARLQPALAEVSIWSPLLGVAGGVTMLVTAVLAVRESDLKRILAYSTISALGTLVLLIGLGGSGALKAMLVFLVAHALYKACLFMVAGNIDHEAGTRDVASLGGLRKRMPWTAAAAVLAAVSMAGLPPTSGFLGKETAFAAGLDERTSLVLSVALLISAVLTFWVAALVGVRPFLGITRSTPRQPHEAPRGMYAPPLLLAAVGVAGGMLVPALGPGILEPALAAVHGSASELELKLWPGLGWVLWLSIAAIVLGFAGSALLDRIRGLLAATPIPRADRVFDGSLAGLNGLARAQTQLLQNGHLTTYLATVLAVFVGLLTLQLAIESVAVWPDSWSDVRLVEAGIAVVVVLSSVSAALARTRLHAVLALGAAGYGVALIFLLFGAPDLAMTQVLIETLTVLLFVAVFRHLPVATPLRGLLARGLDAVLACAFGAVMVVVTWAVVAANGPKDVSEFFLEASRPLAQGRNVVNTILVDFRALDTMGEITVLTVAAIGVIGLLRLRPRSEGRGE